VATPLLFSLEVTKHSQCDILRENRHRLRNAVAGDKHERRCMNRLICDWQARNKSPRRSFWRVRESSRSQPESSAAENCAVCSDLEGNRDAADVDKALLRHVVAADFGLRAKRVKRVRIAA